MLLRRIAKTAFPIAIRGLEGQNDILQGPCFRVLRDSQKTRMYVSDMYSSSRSKEVDSVKYSFKDREYYVNLRKDNEDGGHFFKFCEVNADSRRRSNIFIPSSDVDAFVQELEKVETLQIPSDKQSPYADLKSKSVDGKSYEFFLKDQRDGQTLEIVSYSELDGKEKKSRILINKIIIKAISELFQKIKASPAS